MKNERHVEIKGKRGKDPQALILRGRDTFWSTICSSAIQLNLFTPITRSP